MMIADLSRFIPQRLFNLFNTGEGVQEMYDLWMGANLSKQDGAFPELDKILFARMLDGVNLQNKSVADIGCGTGRNWPAIMQANPLSLAGFDVSAGVLRRLEQKFPQAETYQIIDNHLLNIPRASYDVALSTMTLAYIQQLDEALHSWSRILKPTSDIIITDFHPEALALGSKITFKHLGRQMAVRSFIHTIKHIKTVLAAKNFKVVREEELKIDTSLKPYYAAQNALRVYEKFRDMPIIYGMHLRRDDSAS